MRPRFRPRSTRSTRSPTRRCRRSASGSSEPSSRQRLSVPSCRCFRAATGWCTSPSWATASGSTRSRTWSTWATSCRSRSPRSTPAARSAWCRSSRTAPRAHPRPLPPPPATELVRRRMAALNRTRTRVLERSADGAEVTLFEAPGGLRLITERMPWSRSASIGVWVGVGSIDEQPQLAGASHFLEHLLFKGTGTRSARDIAVAIDGVGGDFNAFTSHEYTCYFVHVLADAAELAVDLVGDVVLDATIPAEDVDVERQVILEEFAMREDNPEDALVDAFSAAVFDGLPIARPVIGNLETIESLSRAQITGYYRRRYRPPSMVVAVAGGIEHAEVWRWVRRAFARRLDREQQPDPIRGIGRR